MSPTLEAPSRSLVELLSWPTYGATDPPLRVVFTEVILSEAHYFDPVSLTRRQEFLEFIFRQLRDQWKDRTRFVSSSTDLISDPAYQAIIGLGESVIPILLKELQTSPNHWFAALNAITHENPVQPEDRGNVAAMTQAWLRWGTSKGVI
jgi:hypothetical protein